MKNLFLLLLLSFFTTAKSQELMLKGKVRFSDKTEGIYRVEVRKQLTDTILIAEKSFHTSSFYLHLKTQEKLHIKIGAPGYIPLEFQLNKTLTPVFDLGEIRMENDTIALKNVTITARRPLIKTDGWKTIVDVKNSTLSDAGSAMDLLKRTPGLIARGDEIEVPGIGTPLYIVDGREVRQNDILYTL